MKDQEGTKKIKTKIGDKRRGRDEKRTSKR
jgi:hypothetical protein